MTPYYRPGDECIDITTGLGYPKKADDAARNPMVSLLFSDPTGSDVGSGPMVLVQGTARVDDSDLAANRERYAREAIEKLPGAESTMPPKPLRRMFGWYFTRIYVHVRPERVYVWPGGDVESEPALLDSHMEEVRSGHDEEPDADRAQPTGGGSAWDARCEELGSTYSSAVLSLVAPDGFPFSVRLPVRSDPAERLISLETVPVGVPLAPGLVCLTAHEHDERFSWQRNFQLRGDLIEVGGGWAVAPHKIVGGFELPPAGAVERMRMNFRKMRRFRRIAKRELAKRA